jgi:ribosome maturation factor RimP
LINDDAAVAGKVREIVEPIIQSEGVELVDLEYRREHRGRVLRLFIDREGGVSINDCVSISHEVDRNLDVAGILPGPYTLEVSSPGLNRPLRREADFQRFANRTIKLRTALSINDRKRFKGKLLGCRDGLVELEENNQVIQVPLDQIVRANLEFEF